MLPEYQHLVVGESLGFSTEEACQIGEEIGIDWTAAAYSVEEFRAGLDVELEHGLHDPKTNVTNDDPHVTGKIARAHGGGGQARVVK